MKTSQARLDWREGRRRRAWERKEAGWKQQDSAAALGVTSGAVSQWLARARAEGGEEGLRRHPAPGPRPPALRPNSRWDSAPRCRRSWIVGPERTGCAGTPRRANRSARVTDA